MNKSKLHKVIDDATKTLGEDRLITELQRITSHHAEFDDAVLTIVPNDGIHHLPDSLHRGQVFYVTRGMLDLSSQSKANVSFNSALKRLARKLKSQQWKTIYIVPFGPAVLAMQIKLLVYRVTHIETIDMFHNKEAGYMDICINLRSLISETV